MSQSSVILFYGVVTFFAMSCGVIAVDGMPPKFKITTNRDTDIIDVKSEKNKTIFSIHSPLGISHAVIERMEAQWTDIVLLRLFLNGLESFSATNGKITIDASVSSQNYKLHVRLWIDGKEDSPLDAKSPYWMEIHIVGDDGKVAIPIPQKDGYFEMRLPKKLFENNPRSINVKWIDFYRD